MLGSSDTILLGLLMSKGFHPRSSNSTTPISYRLAHRSAAPLMLTARELALPSHASTLTLTRLRRQAELVRVDTPDSAFDLLRRGRVDAWASARQVIVDYSAQLPGSRVLKDRYGVNRAAVVVAKGQ